MRGTVRDLTHMARFGPHIGNGPVDVGRMHDTVRDLAHSASPVPVYPFKVLVAS